MHILIPSLSARLLSVLRSDIDNSTHPVVMKASITKAFGIDE